MAEFSICIPNYNYAKYIDITLNSLHVQTFKSFEVLVVDNASTDESIEVIKRHTEMNPNFKYQVNPINIGFAGNLDEVAKMAQAEWMIMLSSDDVIKMEALDIYKLFIDQIDPKQKFVFTSTFEKIDSDGNFIEYLSPKESSIWNTNDKDKLLSNLMGFDVYKVKSSEMLKRCLTKFLNPFNFASTCYPKTLYQKVGGYGGGRLINPDKWFHWKLMSEADYVYYLDVPLFQYRWHNNNQTSLQNKDQVLKYWIDEYRNVFELTDKMLEMAKVTIDQVQSKFVRRVILSHVVSNAKRGDINLAKRILSFGEACYPHKCKSMLFFIVKSILYLPFVNRFLFKRILNIR